MITGGAIRGGVLRLFDLQLTVPIGGAHAQPMVAAAGLPADEPLDPGRLGDRRRELGRLPRVVIHLQLDLADAAIRRPGDARDCDGAGLQVGADGRDVDARGGLDRSQLRPSERHPVGIEAIQRRQLDVCQPLGGRDVAVQARNHQARGVAVRWRKRLTVHGHRDEGLAVGLCEPGSRKPSRPAVERPPDDLRRPRLDSGLVEHLAETNASPQRIPDEVPAHLVRNTLDGDVLLVERHRQQLGVREGEWVVDHTGDRQVPARGIEPGRQQLRVDPVEVRIGDHERRDA